MDEPVSSDYRDSLPPLLLALTLHELAMLCGLRFGVQTARWAGRLTLNPIKHMIHWVRFSFYLYDHQSASHRLG